MSERAWVYVSIILIKTPGREEDLQLHQLPQLHHQGKHLAQSCRDLVPKALAELSHRTEALAYELDVGLDKLHLLVDFLKLAGRLQAVLIDGRLQLRNDLGCLLGGRSK